MYQSIYTETVLNKINLSFNGYIFEYIICEIKSLNAFDLGSDDEADYLTQNIKS